MAITAMGEKITLGTCYSPSLKEYLLNLFLPFMGVMTDGKTVKVVMIFKCCSGVGHGETLPRTAS